MTRCSGAQRPFLIKSPHSDFFPRFIPSRHIQFGTFEERPILAKYKKGDKKTQVFGL
jgi:hypothetical protein